MLSLETKTETSPSQLPLSSIPKEDSQTLSKLSFAQLLGGIESETLEERPEESRVMLALASDKETILPKSIQKESIASLLQSEKTPIVELNKELTTSLSTTEIKSLLSDAKNYLKSQITQSVGFKKSEIENLPKTVKGLTQVAQKFGIDISKITLESVKPQSASKVEMDVQKLKEPELVAKSELFAKQKELKNTPQATPLYGVKKELQQEQQIFSQKSLPTETKVEIKEPQVKPQQKGIPPKPVATESKIAQSFVALQKEPKESKKVTSLQETNLQERKKSPEPRSSSPSFDIQKDKVLPQKSLATEKKEPQEKTQSISSNSKVVQKESKLTSLFASVEVKPQKREVEPRVNLQEAKEHQKVTSSKSNIKEIKRTTIKSETIEKQEPKEVVQEEVVKKEPAKRESTIGQAQDRVVPKRESHLNSQNIKKPVESILKPLETQEKKVVTQKVLQTEFKEPQLKRVLNSKSLVEESKVTPSLEPSVESESKVIPERKLFQTSPKEPVSQVAQKIPSNEALSLKTPLVTVKAEEIPSQKLEKMPLFKAQTSKRVSTQEFVQTKIKRVDSSQNTPKKEKSDTTTLSMLLRGERVTQKEPTFTPDFSVTTARVIAPQSPTNELKSFNSLLRGEGEENSQVQKTDGLNVNKADSLDVKMHEAKQMTKYISQDVKNAIHDYKSPFTRVKVQLNPERLGSVELTVIQRGKNLHINLSSNNAAINALAMNANDLKVQLTNNGINNATLNFNNNSQGSEAGFSEQQHQNPHQGRDAQREYNYFDNEEQNEELMNSLEIVVPHYA